MDEEKERLLDLIRHFSGLIDRIDGVGPVIAESTISEDRRLKVRYHLLICLSILLTELKDKWL